MTGNRKLNKEIGRTDDPCNGRYRSGRWKSGMSLMNLKRYGLLISCLGMAAIFMMTARTADAVMKQRSFASPEEAVSALVEAVKKGTEREMVAVLGPGSRPLVSSGDPVDDKRRRERFLKACEKSTRIELVTPEKAVVTIGDKDFPFPVPVVKKKGKWSFDVRQGREEILNRRIGRNELRVVEVLQSYSDAQREYASEDRDGNGVMEFAQKFISSPGKKDGLYWEVGEGGHESPLGPLIAKAAQEGYAGKDTTGSLEPYHGYYYRILTSQGSHAKGGSFDYLVKGRMVLGFALIAYPARYGSSGIMTFIVNQEGVVYEKDFGRHTPGKASAIKSFDPDKTWKKVEEPVLQVK